MSSGSGWLSGCPAGKLAPGGAGRGWSEECYGGRLEKLAVPLDGQWARDGGPLHTGAGLSAGLQLSHLPPFCCRETSVEYGALHGRWDPKSPR